MRWLYMLRLVLLHIHDLGRDRFRVPVPIANQFKRRGIQHVSFQRSVDTVTGWGRRVLVFCTFRMPIAMGHVGAVSLFPPDWFDAGECGQSAGNTVPSQVC